MRRGSPVCTFFCQCLKERGGGLRLSELTYKRIRICIFLIRPLDGAGFMSSKWRRKHRIINVGPRTHLWQFYLSSCFLLHHAGLPGSTQDLRHWCLERFLTVVPYPYGEHVLLTLLFWCQENWIWLLSLR